MKIAGKEFLDNKTYIMGILNVTPDSFSDGGKYFTPDAALTHVEEMIRDGASIIDVGGESTRPGYTMISDSEELDRVCPVIERIKANFDIPISIDTYKSRVAKYAIDLGVHIVNDIWGFLYDPDMAALVKAKGVHCVLMHNREEPDYNDFMKDMIDDLKKSVELARAVGIEDDKIILDPGVGFGKTYENNLSAILHVDELVKLGFPVLLATSRKSVIGLTLDLPKDQREEGTMATTVYGVMKGCRFVRVHDVAANKRAIDMTEAILSAQ